MMRALLDLLFRPVVNPSVHSRFAVYRHHIGPAGDEYMLRYIRPIWTLVLTGPRRRKWGFRTPTGWVYWRDFLGAWEGT